MMAAGARRQPPISVINFDILPGKNKTRLVNDFPDCMRCLISGPSGSGKSNVLMTILLHKVPMNAIYLCSRTSHQDKYQLLKILINSHNSSSDGVKKKKKKIKYFEVTPDTLEVSSKAIPDSVIIFDDCLSDNQSKIAGYFQHARHKNISLFYLTQSYTKIPKSSGIRENFNYLLLFKMDLVNLRQIYTEHISDLQSFEQFKRMCTMAWSRDRFSFITIDPENENPQCRYKIKFEECIDSNKFII